MGVTKARSFPGGLAVSGADWNATPATKKDLFDPPAASRIANDYAPF